MIAELDVKEIVLSEDKAELFLGPTEHSTDLGVGEKMPVGSDQSYVSACEPRFLVGLVFGQTESGRLSLYGILIASENKCHATWGDHFPITVYKALIQRGKMAHIKWWD